MARHGRRRAMVFVDGSTVRDALKEHYFALRGDSSGKLETSLHYQKLGVLVCGDQREFVRLNYYTGMPTTYTRNSAGKSFMGGTEMLSHEVSNADRARDRFDALQDHIDKKCRFTKLATGRVIARRITSSLEGALDWADQVWTRLGESIPEADRLLVQETRATYRQSRALSERLANSISGLFARRMIPIDLMYGFSQRLSQLLNTHIDFKEKGVDTRLAVDMLELCMDNAYDDAILFAADEDYVPLVEAVKRTGRCVIQSFFEIPNNPKYGFRLRAECDDYRVVTRRELEGLIVPRLSEPEKVECFCSTCREPVHPEAIKCPHCGEQQVRGPGVSPQVS